MSARGVDGITLEQLRAGRQAWWDAAFTRLLLDAVPADATTLIDLGCGLGRAAHDLLPVLPALNYTGVDLDEARLGAARAEIAQTSYGSRADFMRADMQALPFGAGSADVAIIIMTLQHLADPERALVEVGRVLRTGGVLIAIEPDNLDQRVYFDGPEPALAGALVELYGRAREARMPRDLAIGPQVPGLLARSGFTDVRVRAHLTQVASWESARAFVERMRSLAGVVAGAIEGSGESLAAMEAALEAFSSKRAGDAVELSLLTNTVFRVTGTRA